MPRLYHRPPKYCRHKGTNQAIVSAHGKRIDLGPHGSPHSHAKYEQVLEQWQRERNQIASDQSKTSSPDPVTSVTAQSLREKRKMGSPNTTASLGSFAPRSCPRLTRGKQVCDIATRGPMSKALFTKRD